MTSRHPAQVFVQRPSEARATVGEAGGEWRSFVPHGRRQFRSVETPEFDDISEESVTRRKRRALSHPSATLNAGPEQWEIVASYCGQEIKSSIFGALFPSRSFPLDASNFNQVDSHHWLLDMDIFVGEAYDQVSEMCIYLFNEVSLPPEKAVAVYVQSPGSTFQYRGAVYRSCPSAVFALMWPNPIGQMHLTGSTSLPVTGKIGVAIEDLATLPALNVGQHREIEALAMNVGRNLFNFMQSFCNVQGNQLVVPRDVFEQWFKKFEERSKRDPEYLKHFLS